MRLAVLAALVPLLVAPSCKAPESSPLELVRGGPDDFELRFEDNATFDAGRLEREIRPALRDYADSGLAKYAIDDAAYTLRQFYEGEGFIDADVGYEIVERSDKPLVVIRVTEGPRTVLERVDFDGNTRFDDGSLRALVNPGSGGLFGNGTTWYSRARLEAGRARIEGLYFESGHLDVKVTLPDPVISTDRSTAVATYEIVEGVRYHVAEIELEGLPEEWEQKARKAVEGSMGKAWFPRVGLEVEAKVEDVAANNGHPDADADAKAQIDHATGEVRLEVALDPGPAVRIREVRVEGNQKTKEGFIVARVVLEEGDLYDRSKQRESFRNLYNTGIFESVRLRLEDPKEPEEDAEGGAEGAADAEAAPEGAGGEDAETPIERDLVVTVVEGPSIEVYVEPGYGSYEGPRILTGATERNLFGTGRRLTAEIAVAVLAQSGLLRFTEPNVFGPNTEVDLEGFAGRREEPSFTREEVGGAAQLRHRFTRRVTATVRYERKNSRAVDIQADDPEDILAEENVDLSLVSLTPAYDSRNAPFLATDGLLARFTTEVSDPLIGSEIGYVRLLGTLARYFPTGTDQAFAVSFRTGVLLATDGTETFPIQLRFFNGGENTVRSYRQSELGPKDDQGEPIGGEAYSVFSMEYRRMLISRLQGAVFVDAGNVLQSSSDYGSFADVGYAVGVGLRWVLPIGPVRLDLGVNPDPEDGEDSYVLHFSLGTAY